MAFFSRKHYTSPTTLEMSEINNQLLHFPTYYMWTNVLKMFWGKNFLEEHAFKPLKIGLCSAQQLFFSAYYTFKVSCYAPDLYHQLKIHNSL